MEKILITPRSFGNTYPAAFDELSAAGYGLIKNQTGQLFSKEMMIEHIACASGIIVGIDPLDRDVICAAPLLRAISKYGVGLDNIDVAFAKANGISVSTTQGANAMSVADYTLALILACARKIPYIDRQCHDKDWRKVISLDVYGKTIGIVGLGAIGKGVAKRAAGFDMKLLAYDPAWNGSYAESNGIQFASYSHILEEADFITLHLPLTDETRYMVNAESFALMKRSAILINTSRGELVNEADLIEALKTGEIYAAGIDTFEKEPPDNDELYKLDNLVMGSHCAASSVEASKQMTIMATRNIINSLKSDASPA